MSNSNEFFFLGNDERKNVNSKNINETAFRDNHPLHYSRNYTTIRITLILIYQ